MATLLQSIVDFLTHPKLMIGLVWTGMAALTVALIVVMRTSWGQQQPLRKCVVLSLFAHLLFVAYATTVHLVRSHPGYGSGRGTVMRVTDFVGQDAVDSPGIPEGQVTARATAPWETTSETSPVKPELTAAATDETTVAHPEITPIDGPPAPDLSQAFHAAQAEQPLPTFENAEVPAPQAPEPIDVAAAPAPTSAAETASVEPTAEIPEVPPAPPTTADLAKLIAAPAAILASELPMIAGEDAFLAGDETTRAASPLPPHEGDAGALVAIRPRPASTPAPQPTGPHAVPEMYSERTAANRLQIAESYGGSAQTEAAVNAALEWLAKHQDADGRWDASDHGAGQETRTLGQDRKGAGAQADTGLTGLALLAFLGAGHTHQNGAHAATVKRGLEYLLAAQGPDGNLAGQAETYAHMYCHGMAALALCEASAMTGDPWLSRPMRRALAYTVNAQNLASGGWRYKPNERGDTSQLGWQLMALKSAEFSGLPIPERTRQGMVRYLNSVASGAQGGLASYRPEERPTHSMTAEALVCREFLNLSLAGSGDEARDFLLTALPGQGQANFYYWYYGTLAMFRLQGPRWVKWNEAVSSALTQSQATAGDRAGSWEPDPLWGGYGGRVYSTSLGALCLEVYYRYLPLYSATAGREPLKK